MKFPKLLRRQSRPVPDLRFPDEDDDEAARGGYLISGDPDAPPMRLTEPIIAMREDHFSVSVPPHLLSPGQYYLIGGPGQPSCEVVQVDVSGPAPGQPGQPRRILRAMLRTVGSVHPAGTPVTALVGLEAWQASSRLTGGETGKESRWMDRYRRPEGRPQPAIPTIRGSSDRPRRRAPASRRRYP